MHSKIFKIFSTNSVDPRQAGLESPPFPPPLKLSALLPLLPLYFKEGFLDWIAFIIFLQISPLGGAGGSSSRGSSGSRWCLVACLTRLSGQITKLKVWTEISITSLFRPPSERAIVSSRAPASGRYVPATLSSSSSTSTSSSSSSSSSVYIWWFTAWHMCVPWYNCLARRALYLIAAQANKYIFSPSAHILTIPLCCQFSLDFSFLEKSVVPFYSDQTFLCPAYIFPSLLPNLYFFLFCPPIFLAGPNWGSQGGYISLSGREDIPRLITLYPPHALATTILILEKGYLGDICFSNKEIKLWVQQSFVLTKKKSTPGWILLEEKF